MDGMDIIGCCVGAMVLLFIIIGMCSDANAPIENAWDFKVPSGFKEPELKDLNHKQGFAQYVDSLDQTITITKVNNGTDYVDEWFTNKSDAVYTKVVKPASKTNISNLYCVDAISDWEFFRWYVELVEVNGDKYVIEVREPVNLYAEKVPAVWTYDLIKYMKEINKKNKLNPMKVI